MLPVTDQNRNKDKLAATLHRKNCKNSITGSYRANKSTALRQHCEVKCKTNNLIDPNKKELARILCLFVYEICLKLKSGNRIIRIFPT